MKNNVMNKLTNECKSKTVLFDEDEFQVSNMATTDFLAFIEKPEAWELKDFEDVISPHIKDRNLLLSTLL